MNRKILIIDDDPNNIFALKAVLNAGGFEAEGAAGMKEAFDQLASGHSFGIVLLDMMMPGMDGYDALRALKADEHYSNIPVVAVTAQAMTGDREKCIAAGADDYISKPVDTDKLFYLLNEYLK